MFEILSALRELNTACVKHGTRLAWDIKDEGFGMALKAEMPLTDEDVQFVENMRLLLAPVED